MFARLKSGSNRAHLSAAVVLLLLLYFPVTLGMSKDKHFQHDLDAVEQETGEKFELHSQGTLAQLIDLDRMPEVKRVACAGDRLMILMNDTTPALEWKAGQVILGGPEWGCNVTRHSPQATSIYVKLATIYFPLEGQVTIHHVHAGPFDMLEEAKIHFHYEPGRYREAMEQDGDGGEGMERKQRYRRSLSNLVSNILNDVNWQANFSTTIPFNIGGEFTRTANGTDTSTNNQTQRLTLALHKNWGDKRLTLTRGQDATAFTDDFILNLGNLYGDCQLSYTFELEIASENGDPKIVRYINQYEVQASLETDATVSFKRELGMTFNVTLDQTPTLELFRVPLARPRGLPPVYLTVSYNALSAATVSAYSAGQATLSTAFNATGYLTASQQYNAVTKVGSDVTSHDWSIEPWDQHLHTPHRTHVDFSLYQKLTFTSAVSWHYRDVDMELSPPMEVTVRPEVSLRSTTPGVSRCVRSAMTVDGHVYAGKADFTAVAFGIRLWDVALQPAMTRDFHITDGDLGRGCDARCHGPSDVLKEPKNQTFSIVPFSRQDATFSRLQAFGGAAVLFSDVIASSASWCGSLGRPCVSCSQHATGTPPSQTCAPRLMTSRMAAATALLSDYVSAEWPDKRLLVLEAWDEPTSENPTGLHDDNTLYKVGRAATVSLANDLDLEDDIDQLTLDRLGQLAVCAGFDSVREAENETRVMVAVIEDGWNPKDTEYEERQTMFWESTETTNVNTLSPRCALAPYLASGDSWPQSGGPEVCCGPVDRPLHRGDRSHMDTLIQWNRTDASLTFDAEGQGDKWCGHPSRPCRADCSSPSLDLEPWNWCSTRMMTPRVAGRLRKLQMLAEEKGISVRVLRAYSEPTELLQTSAASLYHEGRGLKLAATPASSLGTLASLAVCAGFEYVSYSGTAFIQVFVKAQTGFQAIVTSYIEGPARAAITPVGADDLEYTYPTNLTEESVLPLLVDGGFDPDTLLSEHVRLGDVMSRDRRYFRLDASLLECVELADRDFSGTIELIPDSVYRTRSVNMRANFDLRHSQETWRFQTGQAMEIRPAGAVTPQRLLELATSVLRECPPLIRLDMRAVGMGCHDDRLYVDFRPLVPGYERVYVMVWNSSQADYCKDVIKLQRQMVEGGPVVQSDPEITCSDRQLDPGLEYLTFQMGEESHCFVENQAEFCDQSKAAREKAADTLQRLLTSAAGYGRLPRYELIDDIRACFVDVCGGCAGVGPVFDKKVRGCSRLVHKYIERAASAFPDLTNVTTFFNTDTQLSTVQALACKDGSVCVENTPPYSLFVPTVTARYYPDPQKSLERELFANDVNPTPLLELVAQELAFRAKGKVTVYIEDEQDIYMLRNVLKVLFVYNKNVSVIEFQVAVGVDEDLVMSSILRKLDGWSGVACPRLSRFALSPFQVVTMEIERQRRSAERSVPRNQVKSRMYNWEREWLDRMW